MSVTFLRSNNNDDDDDPMLQQRVRGRLSDGFFPFSLPSCTPSTLVQKQQCTIRTTRTSRRRYYARTTAIHTYALLLRVVSAIGFERRYLLHRRGCPFFRALPPAPRIVARNLHRFHTVIVIRFVRRVSPDPRVRFHGLADLFFGCV